MAFEAKLNTGSLFKNDKMKNENSPPYTGSVKIQCPSCQHVTDYWQSAWVNEQAGKEGRKYFGQKFNPKEAAVAQEKKATSYDLDDDAIPF